MNNILYAGKNPALMESVIQQGDRKEPCHRVQWVLGGQPPWCIAAGAFLIFDVTSYVFVFVYLISAWDLGVLFQFLNLRIQAFLHF